VPSPRGGGVNRLAVRLGPDLNAAVPFYGIQPNAADAAKIKAPITMRSTANSTPASRAAGRPSTRR
jgi:dienelactone hydrolase